MNNSETESFFFLPSLVVAQRIECFFPRILATNKKGISQVFLLGEKRFQQIEDEPSIWCIFFLCFSCFGIKLCEKICKKYTKYWSNKFGNMKKDPNCLRMCKFIETFLNAHYCALLNEPSYTLKVNIVGNKLRSR